MPKQNQLSILVMIAGILLVFGVRLYFARQMITCGVPDSCSYLSLAQSLDAQHVFRENFIADLQLDHLQLPLTGVEYWRPGTSFFLLLAHPFGGVTLHSSLAITTLAGFVLALAAWRTTLQFSDDRSLAAASVLLCCVLPPLFESSLIADSGLFYAAAVAWFLALMTVRSQGVLADALALVCVCVAYTVRNDAVLLILPLIVVLYMRRRIPLRPGSSAAYCLLLLLGFFAALAPAHLINAHVLGKAFPSGTSRVLFFNDLSDLSRYGLVNWETWRSFGLKGLLHLRGYTLMQTLYRLVVVVTGFGCIFLPFLLAGQWRGEPQERTRQPELAGGLAFLFGLLFLYSAVLPAIGVFSALRTFYGLLPLTSVLIVLGIRAATPLRWRELAAAVILFYLVIGGTADARAVAGSTDALRQTMAKVNFLRQQGVLPENSVLLIDDPAQFAVATGYRAIQRPSNGSEATYRAGEDLHATHVLLDASQEKESVSDLARALHAQGVAMMPLTPNVLFTLPAAETQVP